MKDKYIIKKVFKYEDVLNQPIEVDHKDNVSLNTTSGFIYSQTGKKRVLKPGNYKLSGDRYDGVKIKKISYDNKPLQKELSNTQFVKKQIQQFIDNFDVYTKRGRIPKRNVLFYSPPGAGKTSSIVNAIEDFKDKNTLILNWICGSPSEVQVLEWISTEVKYSKNINKLFFVIEDIGGTWENHPINISALLNLLQGSMNIFTVPTMVIATTNHPEKMLESLSNRPRRFDVVAEMPTITAEERYKLLKFYAEDMMEVDETIAKKDKYKSLTIAHLEESIDKALLEKITLEESLDSMVEFSNRFKKAFSKKKGLGIANDD